MTEPVSLREIDESAFSAHITFDLIMGKIRELNESVATLIEQNARHRALNELQSTDLIVPPIKLYEDDAGTLRPYCVLITPFPLASHKCYGLYYEVLEGLLLLRPFTLSLTNNLMDLKPFEVLPQVGEELKRQLTDPSHALLKSGFYYFTLAVI